ncbi:MAG: ABC transporter permease, partial [Betaproteobacteria bacterium]|nr:ABC transporter permease [Betaproteobacteria bacterium]
GLFGLEFGILGVLGAVGGCALGYAAQFAIAATVAELVRAQLPQPSLMPALQGFLTGMALLLGFALPPLMRLKQVPALRVIRRDLGPARDSMLAGYAAGILAIGALLVWQAGEAKLGLIILGGFAGAFLLFGMLAFAALQLMGTVAGAGSVSWRYGLASLRRRSQSNTVQILALALGLTAILLLSFTRNDLLETWKSKIPPEAPNRFIINIQPEQRAPLADFFAAGGLDVPEIYPMVRGRYVAKNEAPVGADDFDERARRLVEREFNLSYLEKLPAHNVVAAGRWFNAQDRAAGALSVEEGIAQTLGWKLGDILSWQVAGQTFSAPIVNLRNLDWDSMRVNFFVIATPGLLQEAPASFITSFHLPADKAQLASRLAERFPNITVVDTSAILRQAQAVMDQVVRAVQFVFLFALGAGVLVLYSALLATQDERVQEAAVMRALGALRAQVLAAQRAEFAALGLLAGLLASAGAIAIGWAIARFVFQFPYQANGWVWAAGPALGLAAVALNAVAGARAALGQPPIITLREG